MPRVLRYCVVIVFLAVSVGTGSCNHTASSTPPGNESPETPAGNGRLKNVLLVLFDDLRPNDLHCYSPDSQALTPTLDRFVESATVFTRAFAQQAVCGPTRNSFLSGRRPQRTMTWNFIDSFRTSPPDGESWASLPGYFKQNGYFAQGAGKVYHHNSPLLFDGNLSWNITNSMPYVDAGEVGPCSTEYFTPDPSTDTMDILRANVSMVCPDNSPNHTGFADQVNLLNMFHKLDVAAGLWKHRRTPFFLAMGFKKPHLPFRFPVKFGNTDNIWEALGPTENISLPQAADLPTNMPSMAIPYSIDGLVEVKVFNETLKIVGQAAGCPADTCSNKWDDTATRRVRKGYLGAIAWVDYLLGELLDYVEGLGLTDDTIVAIMGDHGWALGDTNMWAKQSNFDIATHIPLIVHDAGQTKGRTVSGIVEAVDLYPTLAELAGLAAPPDVDGADLSAYVRGTANVTGNVTTDVAYSEYPRCANHSEPWKDPGSCVYESKSDFVYMGYSMRTAKWRCTLWMWWNNFTLSGDFSKEPVAVELYAHNPDPTVTVEAEVANVADDFPDVVEYFTDLAIAHWPPLYPLSTTTNPRSTFSDEDIYLIAGVSVGVVVVVVVIVVVVLRRVKRRTRSTTLARPTTAVYRLDDTAQ